MLKKIEKIIQFIKQEFNEDYDADYTIISQRDSVEELFEDLGEDIIRLEVGEDFVNYADIITQKINEIRINQKTSNGFILPNIHIVDNTKLQENEFNIVVRGNIVSQCFCIPNKEEFEKELETEMNSIIGTHLENIFSNELTEKYINITQKTNDLLIWNITRAMSVSEIKIILVSLIKANKSIKDINYTFEKIGEALSEYYWPESADAHEIAKKVLKKL